MFSGTKPSACVCQSMTDAQIKEAIKNKATELYEKSGRKPGRDLQNWLEAEKFVKTNAGC